MQAFEAAVRGAVVAEEDVADGVAMQNGSEGRKRRLARLAEENLILKRAVAIQNARQQESGELQRQILELQRACAGYQEQLQQAQRQNYSLGVHLKEALSPQVPSHNNRDVF
jgi:seryl-tRNA synthetase